MVLSPKIFDYIDSDRSVFEHDRATVFEFGGLRDQQRNYIESAIAAFG